MSELGPTITELEPTITELEPTATDRLRALLTERGVEWWEEDGHTLWYGESTHHAASAFSSFLFGENERVHLNAMVTPEQAVEATLGSCNCSKSDSDATAERRGDAVEVVRCRDCKRFSLDNSDHDYRTGWWCKRWYTDMVKPDGFCAWGERRESE